MCAEDSALLGWFQAAEGTILDGGGIIIAGRTAAGRLLWPRHLPAAHRTDADFGVEPFAGGGTIIDAPLYETRAALYARRVRRRFRDWVDHLARLRYNTLFYLRRCIRIWRTRISPCWYRRMRTAARASSSRSVGRDRGGHAGGGSIEPLEASTSWRLKWTAPAADLPYDRLIDAAEARPDCARKGTKILGWIGITDPLPVASVINSRSGPGADGRENPGIGGSCGSVAGSDRGVPSDSETWLIAQQGARGYLRIPSTARRYLSHTGAGYLNRDSRCLDRSCRMT